MALSVVTADARSCACDAPPFAPTLWKDDCAFLYRAARERKESLVRGASVSGGNVNSATSELFSFAMQATNDLSTPGVSNVSHVLPVEKPKTWHGRLWFWLLGYDKLPQAAPKDPSLDGIPIDKLREMLNEATTKGDAALAVKISVVLSEKRVAIVSEKSATAATEPSNPTRSFFAVSAQPRSIEPH